MKYVLGIGGFVALLVYSAFYLYSGFSGITAYAGTGWAWGAVALAVFLKITLPFTFGAFYCAWQVWEWHWTLAALWALPGLAVALPSMAVALIGVVGNLLPQRNRTQP